MERLIPDFIQKGYSDIEPHFHSFPFFLEAHGLFFFIIIIFPLYF